MKTWKNYLQKYIAYFSLIFFSLAGLTALTAQKVKYLFLNVAYRATVYKTGVRAFLPA